MRYFIIILHVLLLSLPFHIGACLLLSRFKNPYEYVATESEYEELMREDIDDRYFEDLMQERPELHVRFLRPRPPLAPVNPYPSLPRIPRGPLAALNALPSTRSPSSRPRAVHFFKPINAESEDTEAAERFFTDDDLLNLGSPLMMQESPIVNDTRTIPPISKNATGRRMYNGPGGAYWSNRETEPGMKENERNWKMAECYWCGMDNASDPIPNNPICHDAFESKDSRTRALARYFRGTCYYWKARWIYQHVLFTPLSNKWWVRWQEMKPHRYGNWRFWSQRGLRRNFYGPFQGGCYKRFLDVGSAYTQRGCRHRFPPGGYQAKSAALRRFQRLEMALQHVGDGCVSSPRAALTPFSRAISLYARYHVCVCSGRYCNHAHTHAASYPLVFVTFLFIKL